MILVKRVKRVALATLAVVALVGGAAGVYRAATWVHEDLDHLAPYSASFRYDALARALQAYTVGPSGFRFVVLGDTRSNWLAAKTVLEHAAEESPTFILNTGDVVHHGTVDEYMRFCTMLAEVAPMPHVPAPGNHDEGPNRNFAAFKALFGADRFSFDYGGCRFVGVNNGDPFRLGWSDMQFLETELNKPGASHKFVFMHIPPAYVQASAGRGFEWHAKAFRQLMQRAGVDQVFMGHIHGYATEWIDGIPYTIAAGGGAPLAETLGEEGKVLNYIVVSVNGEKLSREVVRLYGGEWKRSTIP